ncbi:MAG: hydrogenase 3 maturation protease [Thermococcaceae archaeon]|jgi:hydrogenase 3 maturation protease|uniref:hydrogenase maturation peptidase HycI n=1 Tax=Thermococcus TaxID=2263 RepID=UPI0005B2D171|nr:MULTISPECIES: hydrogenase maturation peptidase HycI [Thermococcus]MDK2854400.1 hydrogenase 3 maturation protease [Thermococcaceae archaeon]MDK2983845.1 hydrogenase 3 maturation protease [Thermococcaceae archaeon]MDN5320337.1 hydrogenase 3 maturation protease [Thermococcaceae archaeon]MPW39351.1 hydrogenase maturation peptidase HycI [Thermococcus sp. 101 C5]
MEEFLEGATKVVVCGIGNDIRGDDAFGVYVVEKLKEKVSNPKVVFLNCGEMPESYVGKIIRENPSHVVFIDAVHFEGKPGEIVLADPEGTLGEAFSTHKMPLKLLVSYLKEQTNAKFILIGAQPKQTGLFVEMSDELRESADKLVELLAELLKGI